MKTSLDEMGYLNEVEFYKDDSSDPIRPPRIDELGVLALPVKN